MFKKIIYGIWCAVAAVTCMCEEANSMYDAEKNQMVFRNPEEREAWASRCARIAISEYGKCGQDSFEKWKKDGERFLEKNFLDNGTFPLLNDGRPELEEWLEGTSETDVFRSIWDQEFRLIKAEEFLKFMLGVYSSQQETNCEHYVFSTKKCFNRYVSILKEILFYISIDKERIYD